jgi:ribosomal protein S18 acetylase RimI-like enzyme
VEFNFEIRDKPREKVKAIECILQPISPHFIPPLESKVDISVYSEKLATKSTIVFAIDSNDNKIAGLIAFYCNNNDTKEAYISVLGVLPAYRGKGIGKQLIIKTLKYIKELNFKKVKLETWSKSSILNTYLNLGFKIWDRVPDRPDNNETLRLEIVLDK